MISLVLIASVLIAGVTIYQYREQSNQYHEQRLQRKKPNYKPESSIFSASLPFPIKSNFWILFLVEVVFQIADEQNVNFRIYNTEGTIITNTQLPPQIRNASITDSTLAILRQNPTTNYVEITEDGKIKIAPPIPLSKTEAGTGDWDTQLVLCR